MSEQLPAISNLAPTSMTSFDAVIDEISSGLSKLKYMAAETDFNDPQQRDRFEQNMAYLKLFYTQGERLIRGDINA